MSDKLQAFLESGKYLPDFLRDFHDQKDVFKMLDDVRERSVKKNGCSRMADLSWVDAHIYTIDIFLWVMARNGYTLQKSRARQKFRDIHETVARAREEYLAQCNLEVRAANV
ncbi:hypothetical protein J2D73_17390 [Acetobacter sacchari]|uniref:Uncharacterized protein n=1 Tax=Acetobacter sacchari TaxID=2661687 RepID=A0ABS3M068_9PROT|nr:hypothetical protein [Acetobacter sacchari]MBO1361562.1 hypothetical protein [Acetobacter sacchari]